MINIFSQYIFRQTTKFHVNKFIISSFGFIVSVGGTWLLKYFH
ncbi:hypothetical protein [Limosilactobacillus reuteri]|nr:hypothetical protein [Limosilactobacillus reuteri]MCW3764572.1 hypothetical protein [Weissella confusa]